jgi:hypothetical protein
MAGQGGNHHEGGAENFSAAAGTGSGGNEPLVTMQDRMDSAMRNPEEAAKFMNFLRDNGALPEVAISTLQGTDAFKGENGDLSIEKLRNAATADTDPFRRALAEAMVKRLDALGGMAKFDKDQNGYLSTEELTAWAQADSGYRNKEKLPNNWRPEKY